MDIYDVELSEDILCMATGFGGGIGHTKNICGAITGSVMALGTVKRTPRSIWSKGRNGSTGSNISREIFTLYSGK